MLLADAKDVRVGTVQAKGVYAGTVLDWPSGFSPPDLAGLAGWYDGSQLALADGAAVNPWPDLSGNGRNLVSAPGYTSGVGTPPTMKVAGKNGLSVVHYTAGGNNVLLNTLPGGVNYGHFFLVAKYQDAAFASYDGLLSGLGGDQYLLIGTGGGTNWYGPGGGGTWDYYYNGVDSRAGLPAPMNAWAHMSLCRVEQYTISLVIGLDRNFGDLGRFWRGDVAEVIAYANKLSTVDRQTVEAYLKSKWGL